MARPLTYVQRLENRAFVKALRRSGNLRLAAREIGVKYGTIQHRRRVHPAFAVKVEAALAFARAWLGQGLGVGQGLGLARSGVPSVARRSKTALRQAQDGRGKTGAYRTVGGEPVLVRTRDGKLQLRRAQPGKLTRECEQAFLAALSATANVSLSAAAAGASPAAFARRKRQCPAFAREMRLALQTGYDRLELALLESRQAGSHEHDDWRRNEPPAMPPITPNQALQLLYLHHKEARLIAEPWPIRRIRGEPDEAYCERLTQMSEERLRRAREAFEIAEAERMVRGEPPWGPAGEDVRRGLQEGRIVLPDLAQVTGWSRADPAKVPHDPRRALFGGWRLEDMERVIEGR